MKTYRVLIQIGLSLIMTSLISLSCSKDPLDAVRDKIPGAFQYLAGIFDGEGVGAVLDLRRATVLFNPAGDQYAWVENGEIKVIRRIDDSLSPFRKTILGSIGPSFLSIPKTAYFFDRSGSRYTTATYDFKDVAGKWDDPDLFSFSNKSYGPRDWGGRDECPFTTIGAIWEYQVNRFCSYYAPDYYAVYMTNGDGNLFTQYAFSKERFGGVVNAVNQYEIYTCDGEDGDKHQTAMGQIPFSSIRAVMTYYGTGSLPVGEVFFISDGKQFGYNQFETGEVLGPFDLY